MKLISHDPFGREELYSERVYTTSCTCDWCGDVKQTKKGESYLFRYYNQQDGIYTRKVAIKGLFCSIGCMRDYHS